MIPNTVFNKKIMAWYDVNGRALPWRETKNPYYIWISEVIFQQTRISQGTDYYHSFIHRFPNIYSLARASEDEILREWQGLGYYRRALNMKKTADILVSERGGDFPTTYVDLLQLPGIGHYTAAAISSICFDEPRAVVDGNVVRVLSRVFDIQHFYSESIGKRAFNQKAQSLIGEKRPGDYNQAIMDYGAMVCTVASPKCTECVFHKNCVANQKNLQRVLPAKRKSKLKEHRYFHYVCLIQEGKIVVEKRLNNDIWKGLYQLPLYEGKRRIRKTTLSKFLVSKGIGIKTDSIVKISNPCEQILTHQVIHSNFYLARKWKMAKKCSNFDLMTIEEVRKLPLPKTLNCFFSDNDLLLIKN